MCKDATERRKKQIVAKRHERMKKDLVFQVGGKPIEIVERFKYLGRVTAKNDNGEEGAVKQNLERAREKWASMRRFLIQDDHGRPKTAVFYSGSGVVCPTLRKRVLATDEGSNAPATKLSPTVLRGLARDCI